MGRPETRPVRGLRWSVPPLTVGAPDAAAGCPHPPGRAATRAPTLTDPPPLRGRGNMRSGLGCRTIGGGREGALRPPPVSTAAPQWISGSGNGSVPSRKSKSQPSWAWLMCAANMPAIAAGRRAALAARRRGAAQLVLADEQIDLPRLHVHLDQVAGPHEGERAADRGFGRDVQDAGAVGGAAHPGVRDAHHVAHALLEQLLRHRQHAPFGHAGGRPARRSSAPARGRR